MLISEMISRTDLSDLVNGLEDALALNLELNESAALKPVHPTQELVAALDRQLQPFRRLSAEIATTTCDVVGPSGAIKELLTSVESLHAIPVLDLSSALRSARGTVDPLGEQFADVIAPVLSTSGFAIDSAELGKQLNQRLETLAERQQPITGADVAEVAEGSLVDAARGVEMPPLVLTTVLATLLSVILTVPATHLFGRLTTDPHLSRMENKIDSLNVAVERGRKENANRMWNVVPVTHVTSRHLVLRSRPDSSSAEAPRVAAGWGVMVIGADGDWSRVLTGVPAGDRIMMGWLCVRYLRPVADSTSPER